MGHRVTPCSETGLWLGGGVQPSHASLLYFVHFFFRQRVEVGLFVRVPRSCIAVTCAFVRLIPVKPSWRSMILRLAGDVIAKISVAESCNNFLSIMSIKKGGGILLFCL